MSSHRDESNWKKNKNTIRQQKREPLDHQADAVDGKHAQCANRAKEIDKISKSECDEELLNWHIH